MNFTLMLFDGIGNIPCCVIQFHQVERQVRSIRLHFIILTLYVLEQSNSLINNYLLFSESYV